jgi:hypothetical protein
MAAFHARRGAKLDSDRRHMTRFIFITGGVVSSLGKGITSACLGAILEARGLKVRLMKLELQIIQAGKGLEQEEIDASFG